MKRLEGKTAIITGSGQNIGQSIAERFAEEGANVIVNGSKSKEHVDAVVRGIRERGGRAIGVMADVSVPEQVQAMIEEGEKEFGAIDIAVNNVGRRLRMKFDDITVKAWRETLEVNLSSVFYMTHYLIPKMRQRKWGRIINIAGYDGFTGHFSERAANVTAKAGMHGLTKAIAREAGVDFITCNTVVPGAIQTVRDLEQYKHVNVDRVMDMLAIKHPGAPKDIAEACLFLAASSGDFITGQAIHVNGGEYMF